jgi:hypothetical protein
VNSTLRDLDYRTIGAPDANAALAILEQPSTKIDLMLTDVVMPGINGRELSRRALELRPGLKVHRRFRHALHLLGEPIAHRQNLFMFGSLGTGLFYRLQLVNSHARHDAVVGVSSGHKFGTRAEAR